MIVTCVVTAAIPSVMMPCKVPSGIVMPSPAPAKPAVVAQTEVRSIPSIPRIIPGIIPSIIVVPEEGIVEAIAMIAMKARRIVEVSVIFAAIIITTVVIASVVIDVVAIFVQRIRTFLKRITGDVQSVAGESCDHLSGSATVVVVHVAQLARVVVIAAFHIIPSRVVRITYRRIGRAVCRTECSTLHRGFFLAGNEVHVIVHALCHQHYWKCHDSYQRKKITFHNSYRFKCLRCKSTEISRDGQEDFAYFKKEFPSPLHENPPQPTQSVCYARAQYARRCSLGEAGPTYTTGASRR